MSHKTLVYTNGNSHENKMKCYVQYTITEMWSCMILLQLVLTGVITVRSGRWLPPAAGWLLKMTSPSCKLSPRYLICKYVSMISTISTWKFSRFTFHYQSQTQEATIPLPAQASLIPANAEPPIARCPVLRTRGGVANACKCAVPATVQFPALHRGGPGCAVHWQLVHHLDQTKHKRNRVAPETKANSTR